jgi:hypothetical protein
MQYYPANLSKSTCYSLTSALLLTHDAVKQALVSCIIKISSDLHKVTFAHVHFAVPQTK